MTMEFNVRNTNELSGIAVGDTITFRLTATEETHWIDQVSKIASTTNRAPESKAQITPSQIAELKPGDLLPDYELIAETGKAIRFSDFRGKAVAFTFIFTRCPLPDYCPRMGNNFAKTRELILATTSAPTNWQFLSISFDPDFDKPAVLSSYANFYRNDNADRWLFAAAPMSSLAQLAPRLDLMVIRVLCNHSVLTTGFDAPKTDMVLIARQVFSPVRYMQMIGRGLRGEKNGGTPRCRLVTVLDNLGRFGNRHPYHFCAQYFSSTRA